MLRGALEFKKMEIKDYHREIALLSMERRSHLDQLNDGLKKSDEQSSSIEVLQKENAVLREKLDSFENDVKVSGGEEDK